MKKLILASASLQRQKLLKDLGVQFAVKVSQAQEAQKIRSTCSALVKHNALLKAQDVAARLKSGVVVGADTVVYDGHKNLIGKPRNLQDAKKMLHALFSKPHWVYTGVAVIDAATGKRAVDYEKTKVFMLPLTDEEIDRYHRKVSPLDKAGGFDIEGGGSVFIHRIEGCYTNVIGLPIAKLAMMLRRFGVSIL
ncbi:MAG TPA: Maf family protein [Candidatus Omnitrophota bacterium]|nr:Maf family protein [Candidatus Omnitrophota bacterium]